MSIGSDSGRDPNAIQGSQIQEPSVSAEPKIYMVIDEGRIKKTQNKDLKSSAKSIAQYMKTPEAMRYIEAAYNKDPKILDNIQKHLEGRVLKSISPKSGSRIVSFMNRQMARLKDTFKTSEDYHLDALAQFWHLRESVEKHENHIDPHVKAHASEQTTELDLSLEEIIKEVKEKITPQLSTIISSLKPGEDAVHLKKRATGLPVGITVTKEGKVFAHIKQHFAKGAQKAVKFTIDVETGLPVVRGVKENLITNVKRAEILNRINGHQNLMESHSGKVFSQSKNGSNQEVSLTKYYAGGELTDRNKIILSNDPITHYFQKNEEKKNQLDQLIKEGIAEGKTSEEVIRDLLMEALPQVTPGTPKRKSQDFETNPLLDFLKSQSSNRIAGQLIKYNNKQDQEGINQIVGLFVDAVDGKDTQLTLNSEKQLSEAETLVMAFQTTSALHTVHAQGAVHQDVKPDNFFLDSNSNTVLGDFDEMVHVIDELNNEGGLFPTGTTGYQAPEVLMSITDQKSQGLYQVKAGNSQKDILRTIQSRDSFAWGASMFENLHGTPPPHADPKNIGYDQYNKQGGRAVNASAQNLAQNHTTIDPEPQEKETLNHLAWKCRHPDSKMRPTMDEGRKECARLMMSNEDAANLYLSRKQETYKEIQSELNRLLKSPHISNRQSSIHKLQNKIESLKEEITTILKNSDPSPHVRGELKLLRQRVTILEQELEPFIST